MNPHFVARESCPACSSEQSETLYANSFTEAPISDYMRAFYSSTGPGAEFEFLEGARYLLRECQACGLIYQYEIPGPALMERLYERWLNPEVVRGIVDDERSGDFYLWCAAEITRVLRFLERPIRQVKFLDFGMGWGNWCLIAKGFGCQVYGTELSAVRVEHAVRLGVEPVQWTQVLEHRFDFINAEQVFEHLADPLGALRHLRQALSPNGVIRINVPSANDVKSRLAIGDWLAPEDSNRSLNDVAPLQHINCFNFRSLVTLARLAGLEEVKIEVDLLQPRTTGGRLKAAARPYLHALMPAWHEARRRKSTNLCFRPAQRLVPENKGHTIRERWVA